MAERGKREVRGKKKGSNEEKKGNELWEKKGVKEDKRR